MSHRCREKGLREKKTWISRAKDKAQLAQQCSPWADGPFTLLETPRERLAVG